MTPTPAGGPARVQRRRAYARRLVSLPCACFLVAWLASCERAPREEPAAVLEASFLYDGKPYPATLTLVADNGSDRPTRTAQTGMRVSAAVPGAATLTIDAMLPPADSDSVAFRDIIPDFVVPAGDTLRVEFVLPVPATDVPFSPAVLMRGMGADPTVVTELSRGDAGEVTVISRVSATAGAPTILDGYYFGLDSPGGIADTTARDFICAAPCAHVFPQDLDCFNNICRTCSTTAKLVGNYWKKNYNMCEIRAPGGSNDPVTVRSTFTRLAAGVGGVHLAVLLRDGRAVAPRQLSLVRLADSTRTALPASNSSARYPAFVTPAGDYRYEITSPGDAGMSLQLPVAVTDGRVTDLHVELPDTALLAGSRPVVVADDRAGVIARETSARETDQGVQLELTARGFDIGTGWVLLPLAPDARLRGITLREDDGPARPLQRGRDYLEQRVGDQPAVVVRSGARRATFDVQLYAGEQTGS